ncbi:MAG: hypothetical protein WBM34_14215, partial [Woeseiaceae bacterium]
MSALRGDALAPSTARIAWHGRGQWAAPTGPAISAVLGRAPALSPKGEARSLRATLRRSRPMGRSYTTPCIGRGQWAAPT